METSPERPNVTYHKQAIARLAADYERFSAVVAAETSEAHAIAHACRKAKPIDGDE